MADTKAELPKENLATTKPTALEPNSDANTITTPATTTDEDPKHPLQNTWKFWYFENVKDRSWEDNLRVVSPFSTVEDFWSIYSHIKSATELRNGGSYFVFKDGIKPMWEDAGNKKGGRWTITIDKRQRQTSLDSVWLEVLLCLIGEAFDDDGDDICGAVVDIRMKLDRVSIWTADCNNRDRIVKIGKTIKQRISQWVNASMSYESHEATAVKSSSSVKPLFTC